MHAPPIVRTFNFMCPTGAQPPDHPPHLVYLINVLFGGSLFSAMHGSTSSTSFRVHTNVSRRLVIRTNVTSFAKRPTTSCGLRLLGRLIFHYASFTTPQPALPRTSAGLCIGHRALAEVTMPQTSTFQLISTRWPARWINTPG